MRQTRIRLGKALLPFMAALAIAGLAGSAQAQITSEQQSAIRGNCRSDFQSKCSGVTPGGKDALNCLQRNVAILSPGCKAAVSATLPPPPPPPPPAPAKPVQAAPPPPAAAAPPPAAPPAPAQRTITTAPPPAAVAPKPQQATKPPAAVPAPMAPLPPPAQPVVPQAKIDAMPAPARLAVVRSCRQDQDAVCSGVSAGGGRIIACLAANRNALSAGCKAALDSALR